MLNWAILNWSHSAKGNLYMMLPESMLSDFIKSTWLLNFHLFADRAFCELARRYRGVRETPPSKPSLPSQHYAKWGRCCPAAITLSLPQCRNVAVRCVLKRTQSQWKRRRQSAFSSHRRCRQWPLTPTRQWRQSSEDGRAFSQISNETLGVSRFTSLSIYSSLSLEISWWFLCWWVSDSKKDRVAFEGDGSGL